MADLFGQSVNVSFPRRYEIDGVIHGNRVQRIAESGGVEAISFSPYASRTIQGFVGNRSTGRKVVVLPKRTTAQLDGHDVLLMQDVLAVEEIVSRSADRQASWLRPTVRKPADIPPEEASQRVNQVRQSWKDRFFLKEEVRGPEGVIEAGLRPPQVGAVHAALAHWSVSTAPATIVMPTGTGKTETMLALTASLQIPRLLVVVPNGPLRDQIAEKFLTFGVLGKAGCLLPGVELPSVATLRHRPTTAQQVDDILLRVNVIVTTMQIAGQCDLLVQQRMAELCSHLFIDEAHHIAAKTWRDFKAVFADRVVLQFTATPFRTDGKRVDGKFIYVYPLSKAQREGYFKPVRFRAVQGLERERADAEIIRRVGEQLDADHAAGHDHLAMARADSIPRATALHASYAVQLARYRPLLIHSKLGVVEKEAALAALRNRKSRIIVCVDMLGEGFDLPQLKVAGLHDRHKSIAITLQFTGRFTRDAQDIGDATVIANIEQDDIDATLRTLYAEDADWNFLLSVLSESRTSKQIRRAEIIEGFGSALTDIPLQTLNPRMNAVVYRTDCDEWRPDQIEDAYPPGVLHAAPVINDERRIAVFVTREEFLVRWSVSKTVLDTEWHLFLVHRDPETKLLYIASSRTDELHEKLARKVAGNNATRISGEPIYRSLAGINRLVLTNLGLSQIRGRYVRYMMFVGSDITGQLPDAASGTKRKSNLFGQGFSGERKLTIGCSSKGKIWSMQSAADFAEWIEWCHALGRKLLDETIATDQFIRNLVKQEVVTERPAKPAVAIHWPEGLLIQFEERIDLQFGDGEKVGFHDCEIDLLDHSDSGPLRFSVSSVDAVGEFEIQLSENGATYTQVAGPAISITLSKKPRLLSEYLAEDPPPIYFADGDFLISNELFKLPEGAERRMFDEAKISAIDWTNIDFRRESQGTAKDSRSIQHRVIQTLLVADPPYDIIFDDDGKGEVADVVAIRLTDNKLHVDLFHCKYSKEAQPGHRVADLYEVCGQAQKSIRWFEYPVRLLKRLRKRENDRVATMLPSRFEKGSLELVRTLITNWQQYEHSYSVTIVQPGLAKSEVEPQQLDLLAATESFLLETYGAPLAVIATP